MPTAADDLAAEAVRLLARITGALPSGEDRPQQDEMCAAVARAVGRGRHLVVQAGTGTGKSLAYAVPAVASGRKVVVATATKALQDQLADKDLPSVAAVAPFTFGVLKGRSNYLCVQRAKEVAGDGLQTTMDDAEGAGDGLVDQVRRLVAWGKTTETGDRATLEFEPSDRAWATVSVGRRECPGAFRCPSGGECFAERARAAAAAADLVVVNTHLYGAHLASGGAVLPPHDVVVFDEAHEVEAIMTESLGVEVTPGRFRALAAAARPLVADGAVATDVADAGDRLADALRDRVGARLGDAEVAAPLTLGAARVARLVGALQDTEDDARGVRARNAAGHLAADLARLAASGEDDVVWADGTPRAPVLRLSPIDVGPVLADALFNEVTAVLTSATIPLRLPERLGLVEYDALDVGSPFDYRTHALLYVAKGVPDPRAAGAEPAVHDELAHLIEAAGGRTLALFTSRRATEAAVSALRDRLDYPLLAQGDLPKGRLLEAFADDEPSCLFATLGFWQGVDIPGRSLSLVTVDRLPFAPPHDPVLEARRERAGPNAFRLVDLPRAATLLAQAAGRLVRSATDQGVVAVLDPRLATSGYGRVLLAALPPMRRTTDRRQAEDFLRRILAEPA